MIHFNQCPSAIRPAVSRCVARQLDDLSALCCLVNLVNLCSLLSVSQARVINYFVRLCRPAGGSDRLHGGLSICHVAAAMDCSSRPPPSMSKWCLQRRQRLDSGSNVKAQQVLVKAGSTLTSWVVVLNLCILFSSFGVENGLFYARTRKLLNHTLLNNSYLLFFSLNLFRKTF